MTKAKTKTKNKCCLCLDDYGKYGNNAQPVKDGRCCDKCNNEKVMPERIRRMLMNQ